MQRLLLQLRAQARCLTISAARTYRPALEELEVVIEVRERVELREVNPEARDEGGNHTMFPRKSYGNADLILSFPDRFQLVLDVRILRESQRRLQWSCNGLDGHEVITDLGVPPWTLPSRPHASAVGSRSWS